VAVTAENKFSSQGDREITTMLLVDCVWNVMAQGHKPDFVFRRKGRVHLNPRGCQFSRLIATEVCASTVVMLDTPFSEVLSRMLLPTPIASFPFTNPPVRHRVPSHFIWSLLQAWYATRSFLLLDTPLDLSLPYLRTLVHSMHIHSFSILSDDRSKVSFKTIPPHSAI
jgi:hypothetical protein